MKKYIIDLNLPPENRWHEMMSDKWALKWSKKLANRASKEMSDYIDFIQDSLRMILATKSDENGYVKEIREWVRETSKPFEILNCYYELIQGTEWINDKYLKTIGTAAHILGSCSNAFSNIVSTIKNGWCSSVALYKPKLGMVHARNMDWPLDGIDKATCLVDFINAKAGNFTAVTCPGFVGVVSGVAKGRFSASINMALPCEEQNLMGGWSAPLLLRNVFENCKTYKSALQFLKKSKSVAPFFIQLVGVKKGQASVIEVMPKSKNGYYEMEGGQLAITNHFLDADMEDLKEDDILGYSLERLECIRSKAYKCRASTLRGVFSILNKEPVMNGNTMQSMVFHPKSGKVLLNPHYC